MAEGLGVSPFGCPALLYHIIPIFNLYLDYKGVSREFWTGACWSPQW